MPPNSSIAGTENALTPKKNAPPELLAQKYCPSNAPKETVSIHYKPVIPFFNVLSAPPISAPTVTVDPMKVNALPSSLVPQIDRLNVKIKVVKNQKNTAIMHNYLAIQNNYNVPMDHVQIVGLFVQPPNLATKDKSDVGIILVKMIFHCVLKLTRKMTLIRLIHQLGVRMDQLERLSWTVLLRSCVQNPLQFFAKMELANNQINSATRILNVLLNR